jgi:uncharacterized protein
MSDAVLRQIAQHALEYFEEADVVFHAGEPLTVGLDWFTTAVDAFTSTATRLNRKIRFGVQTNGVLVNDAWTKFFVEKGFMVGVSLDGPAHIHDAARRSLGGQGSHARSERGFRLLNDAGLRPNVLAVLTEAGLRQPDELYDYFAALGVETVGFNVEDATATHLSQLGGVANPELLYENFIRTFIERLRADPSRRMSVREVQYAARAMLAFVDFQQLPDADVRRPLGIVSYDVQGNFGTFCPELMTSPSDYKAKFTLGSVTNHSLHDVQNDPRLAALTAEIERGAAACASSCDYFNVCGGGKPSTKMFELGTLEGTETLSCRLRVQAVSRAVVAQLGAPSMAS